MFIDRRSAFDTANHVVLSSKLEHFGVRGIFLEFFQEFLSERQQYASINRTHSSPRTVSIGVQRGRVQGPMRFLVYVNDFPNLSNTSYFTLFADDTNFAPKKKIQLTCL